MITLFLAKVLAEQLANKKLAGWAFAKLSSEGCSVNTAVLPYFSIFLSSKGSSSEILHDICYQHVCPDKQIQRFTEVTCAGRGKQRNRLITSRGRLQSWSKSKTVGCLTLSGPYSARVHTTK